MARTGRTEAGKLLECNLHSCRALGEEVDRTCIVLAEDRVQKGADIVIYWKLMVTASALMLLIRVKCFVWVYKRRLLSVVATMR